LRSYFSVPTILIIPPGVPFSSLEKLVRPFHQSVWLLTFIALAFGFATIASYNKLSAEQMTVVDFLVVIFGGSQKKLPQTNFFRAFFALFFLFTMIQRTLYQAAMFRSLQSDGRHREAQTIDEMMKKQFNFYMYPSFEEHFRDMKFFSR